MGWEVNPEAKIVGRIGKTPSGNGISDNKNGCPDVLKFDDGTYGFIGRDVTDKYTDQLPADMAIRHDERLVMLPGVVIAAAKNEIEDV